MFLAVKRALRCAGDLIEFAHQRALGYTGVVCAAQLPAPSAQAARTLVALAVRAAAVFALESTGFGLAARPGPPAVANARHIVQ